ncbi:MAG TPA: LON peptidase substrate-binding domain-containing protein, partial [Planctomycetota bacterium]|nr:LON peptidase substrate-binding domain-containing protein [Planctomycetota bacterium]
MAKKSKKSRGAASKGDGKAPSREREVVLLPVRNMVLFPGMALPLSITRERSRRIVEAAVAAERPLGLLLQTDAQQDEPGAADLHRVGTLTTILRYVAAADDGAHMAVCQGQQRFRVLEFLGGELGSARVELLEDLAPTKAEQTELDALFATLKRQGLDALALMPGAPPQVAQLLETAEDPGVLA